MSDINENPLKAAYQQVYGYFTDSLARKVLFFALCACVVMIFLAAIVPSDGTSTTLVLAFIIAVGATAYDTWDQRKRYKSRIEATEMDYFTRIAESSGEKAAMEADGVFGEKERMQIKKKLREFNISFIVKLVFLAILVVFLISLL